MTIIATHVTPLNNKPKIHRKLFNQLLIIKNIIYKRKKLHTAHYNVPALDPCDWA